MITKFTPGPWAGQIDGMFQTSDWSADMQGARTACSAPIVGNSGKTIALVVCEGWDESELEANAKLISAAPDLLEALKEARRAIGGHYPPNDCYATGPLTGDEFRDLIQCPACSAIAMYDKAIAKATGEQE